MLATYKTLTLCVYGFVVQPKNILPWSLLDPLSAGRRGARSELTGHRGGHPCSSQPGRFQTSPSCRAPSRMQSQGLGLASGKSKFWSEGRQLSSWKKNRTSIIKDRAAKLNQRMCCLHCRRIVGYLERVSLPISSALVDALAQNSFTNALSLAERLIVPLGCAKILPVLTLAPFLYVSWHETHPRPDARLNLCQLKEHSSRYRD